MISEDDVISPKSSTPSMPSVRAIHLERVVCCQDGQDQSTGLCTRAEPSLSIPLFVLQLK